MNKNGPILLIDDDQDECELIKIAVHELGLENECICFSDPTKAFDYIKAAPVPPFLILSDINMPKMDGLDLRRMINQDEAARRKSIPFIFLTTTATQDAVEEAYEMSVQGFFEKPVNFQMLVQRLKMITDYWMICRHPNSNFVS